MILALEIGTSSLKCGSNWQLRGNQVAEEYQTKEPRLIKYLENLYECFKAFGITYVPKEKKFMVNLLSKLANTKRIGYNHTVIQETLPVL